MKLKDLEKIRNSSRLIINNDQIFRSENDVVSLTDFQLEDFQLVSSDVCFNLKDLKYYKIIKQGKNYEMLDINSIYKNYINACNIEDCLDDLTQVLSRKILFEKYFEYLKYAFTYDEEFAVIMADIDYFKKFNDTYGHIFGDKVLVSVANVLNENVRNSEVRSKDLVGRYGGEEFLIVLKNLTADNAYNVCEKLRVAIETNEVDSKSVTMSFGLFHVSHSFIQENQNIKPEDLIIKLIELADEQLYKAKINRNCVVGNDRTITK